VLAPQSPQEAYRRVDFDARAASGDPRDLVAICFEQLTGSLATALRAQELGDNAAKSKALTRALSAVLALLMGVSGDGPVTDALRHFYDAARRTVLDSAINFDANALDALRQDCVEIAGAMRGGFKEIV